jgi:hypothetical protein
VDDIGSLHVDTIAGILKRFLRSLPQPIIPFEDQESFRQLVETRDAFLIGDSLYHHLQRLSKNRKHLLMRLLPLLRKVGSMAVPTAATTRRAY